MFYVFIIIKFEVEQSHQLDQRLLYILCIAVIKMVIILFNWKKTIKSVTLLQDDALNIKLTKQ